jgi:hypothetical protein
LPVFLISPSLPADPAVDAVALLPAAAAAEVEEEDCCLLPLLLPETDVPGLLPPEAFASSTSSIKYLINHQKPRRK